MHLEKHPLTKEKSASYWKQRMRMGEGWRTRGHRRMWQKLSLVFWAAALLYKATETSCSSVCVHKYKRFFLP